MNYLNRPCDFNKSLIFTVITATIFAVTIVSCDTKNDTDFNNSNNKYDGPINTCKNNSDCQTGYCNSQLKVCAVNGSNKDIFTAKIIVSDITDKYHFTGQQLFSVNANNSKKNLNLLLPVKVESIDPGIIATVLFADQSNSLSGFSSPLYVYKAGKKKRSFYLFPGLYNVTIIPDNSDKLLYPVYTLGTVSVTPEGVFKDLNDNIIDIKMPHIDDDTYKYKTVSGTVSYVKNNNELFIANNLRVRAVDDSGNFISSIDYTHCLQTSGCGKFSLKLDNNVDTITILVDKPDEPFYPVYRFKSKINSKKNIQLIIPAPSAPLLVHGKVKGNNENIDTIVPACTIVIEMELDAEDKTLRYEIKTDESGRFERKDGVPGVYLYPGTYRMTAYPRVSNDDNLTVFQQTTTPEPFEVNSILNNYVEIQLSSRINITGTTITHDKRGIPGTLLTAYDINSENMYSTVYMLSNSESTFSTWLNDSVYRVIAIPPVISNFAAGVELWNIKQSPEVSNSIELHYPIVVEGEVYPGKVTDSVEGLIIEWYKEYSGHDYLVSHSTVLENGFFRGLLPAR